MRKLLGASLALLAILFAASCSSPNSFATMVPEDALMVAYMNEPESFLAKTDAFMTASGLGAFTGGQSLEKLLAASANIDLAKAREVIDLKKPAGIILTGTDLTAPQVSVLIPVKEAEGAKTWIGGITGGDSSITFDGPFNGYLVMRPSTQTALVWPPAKAINASVLVASPAHHVSFAIDYGKLMSSPIMAMSMEEMYAELPGMAPLMKDMLGSMGWLSMSLGVDDKNIVMKGIMQVNPGTEYGKLMTGMTGGKADTSKLGTEEIFGMASNVQIKDPAAYMAYIKKMLAAFNLQGAELDSLMASMEKLLGASGGNSVVTMDLDVPAGLDDNPELLDQFGLKVAGYSEVKDSKLVQGETENILKIIVSMMNPLINDLIAKELAKASDYDMDNGYFDEETGEWVQLESFEEPAEIVPPEVNFSLSLAKDQGDSFKYDQIIFDLELSGGDVEELQAMLPALKKIMDTRIAYKDGKAYFAMGTNSLVDLEASMSGKIAGGKLSDAPGFADLMANLDPQAQIFAHISVARIMNKAGKATENPATNDENVPGVLITSSVRNNSTEFAMAFSTKEFQTYLMSMLPLIMSLAN